MKRIANRLMSLVVLCMCVQSYGARLPYIQNVTETSVVIMWRTDAPVAGRIDYRPVGDPGIHSVPAPESDRQEVTVSSLEPGTDYEYEVYAGETQFGTGTFSTPPNDPTAPVSFLVFGDSGCRRPADPPSGCYQDEVAAAMAGYLAEHPVNLLLHVGDVSQRGGCEADYQAQVFDIYGDIINSVPFYPTIGNHDLTCDGGASYELVFCLPPAIPPGGSPTERFYSFNYGAVHFVSLDTNAAFDPLADVAGMTAWLENDLRSHDRQWTIVSFHHPMYQTLRLEGCGPLEEETEIRRLGWDVLFDHYGVDLVLSGHRHNYSRTHPIRRDPDPNEHPGGPGVIDPPRLGVGVVYLVTGGGGASLHGLLADERYVAVAELSHHFTHVSATCDTLTITTIEVDTSNGGAVGDTIDSHEISRPCDCDADGTPDQQEIAEGGADIDENRVPDNCDPDCNQNGLPDGYDLLQGTSADCNNNGIPDGCDYAGGIGPDCNANGIPDECEADCNMNGIPDTCDLADCDGSPWCRDCNANGRIDECDVGGCGDSEDCNANEIPDECDVADCDGSLWCQDCDSNGAPDECDIAGCDPSHDFWCRDCNENSVPDGCDIENGESPDADHNCVPDDCQIYLGDMNCDGALNALDIDPFTLALADASAYQKAYPECDRNAADCNCDGVVNAYDIDPFVQNVVAGSCVCVPLYGDCNCDGVVNGLDNGACQLAITSEEAYRAAYPDCRWLNADCNCDCRVNSLDLGCIADCLMNGCDCPSSP